MASHNLFKRWTQLASVGLLSIGLIQPAHAALFVQELDYSASDSLWGPGGNSFSFNASGSTSVGVVDLFKYDLGVDSGTVTARHEGALHATYDDVLSAPGSTSINLGWVADDSRQFGTFGSFTGGQMTTDLGVYANVEALSFSVLDADYSVNINKRHRPDIPDSVSGTDNSSGVSASIDIFVAEAGAELQPTLTSTLDVSSLSGVLGYSKRGSGVMSTTSFSTDGSGIDLSFDLPEAGFWDFMLISDPVLNNLYSSNFGLDLVLFEEHLTLFDGRVRNEKNLGTLVSFAGSAFELSFANSTSLGSFSIFVDNVVDGVAVPEPGSLSLLALGLLSLMLTRRRSQRGQFV